MKPFNIEEAKAGKPVCTRDGKQARIFSFNFKGKTYPIVAAIEKEEDKEIVCYYTSTGHLLEYNKNHPLDLMMGSIKRESWAVLEDIVIHLCSSQEVAEKRKGKGCRVVKIEITELDEPLQETI